MLEVCPRLLLGSMGDALAVFTRVRSVVAQYRVTHVLSLCNERPEWMDVLAAPEQNTGSNEEAEGVEEDEETSLTKETTVAENSEDDTQGKPGRRRRREGGSVELPKWKKFIEVADMPKSDLLHHFEPCCHFIKEGRERGTVLVHCEHGVSRSVTVVLAYQMWAEGRSLKTLYRELKDRRPEIRPNAGFMDQLRLWEEMGCRIRGDNKKYRAYQLQCKAREMESAGYIEAIDMSPDPAATPVDAALYFRCRKCRQLLFTDGDVLQHELGEGRASFQRHKQRKGRQGGSIGSTTGQGEEMIRQELKEDVFDGQDGVATEVGVRSLPVQQDLKSKGADKEDGECVDDSVAKLSSSLEKQQESGRVTGSKKTDEETGKQAVLGGNTDLHVTLPDSPLGQIFPPSPLSMVDDSDVLMGDRGVKSAPLTLAVCSSYFIEPVAWMGQALLGHMEGKILCPKCNSRLGSFSWKGKQCSCGRWLTPAFQVHKNRVDEVRTLSRRKRLETI